MVLNLHAKLTEFRARAERLRAVSPHLVPDAVGDLRLCARRVLDLLLAEAVEAKKAQIRKRIAVFAQYLGGNGDLIFGVKATRLLRAEFPNCTIKIVTNKLDNLNRVADGLQGAFSVQSFGENAHPVDFVIQAPVTTFPLQQNDVPYFLKQATQRPIHHVAEYGFTDKMITQAGAVDENYFQFISAGFAPSEIGIFIDPRLLAFSKNPSTLNSSTKRRGDLKDLTTTKLKEAIWGGTTSPPDALAPAFYFCYVQESEPANNFLKLIACLEAHTKRNVVVYVGGAGHQDAGLDREWIKERANWAEDGAGEFHFPVFERWNFTNVNNAPVKDAARSFMVGSGNRRLKLIASSAMIPNADVHTLLRCSESIVSITGNQSLTEAVVAGKIIAYEILDTPVVLRDLVNLARGYKLDCAAAWLLALASKDSAAGPNVDLLRTLVPQGTPIDRRLKTLAQLLVKRAATVRDEFAKLAARLAENHDLKTGLVGVVARGVLKHAEARRREREIMRRIGAAGAPGAARVVRVNSMDWTDYRDVVAHAFD